MDVHRKKELLKALDPFRRAANVIDALPNAPDNEAGLRGYLPGVWPTMGDLRRLRELYHALGGKP